VSHCGCEALGQLAINREIRHSNHSLSAVGGSQGKCAMRRAMALESIRPANGELLERFEE